VEPIRAVTLGPFQVDIANQADAAGIRIPLPPLPEQRVIVQQVGSRTAKVDQLIEKAREVVEMLQEYRSALITDAVTGKIDVRGAA
jgi:type I restriction enzyme S subunit